MILGLIDVTSHDGNNLWDVEGQVLVDSKNYKITKEVDEVVNLFSNLSIPIHDSLVEVNQALIAWLFRSHQEQSKHWFELLQSQ